MEAITGVDEEVYFGRGVGCRRIRYSCVVLVLEHKLSGFIVLRYRRIGYLYRTGETHFP